MNAVPITLGEIEAAAARLAGRIRRTPMIDLVSTTTAITEGELLVKLENLQISGSFKVRGATNTLLSLPADEIEGGLITASGGNHGLGVAAAARSAGVPATIYLPRNTPKAKAAQLAAWGAEVVFEGAVWDDANRRAQIVAAERGLAYVHPFAAPTVIAGQGTVGLEILADAADLDTLVVAIGGGGLMSGVSTAVKACRPAVRVIGVEPTGAPTLRRSLDAGRPVELPSIDTAANTLAPLKSEQINVDIISRNVDDIVLVSDQAMRDAARWLWFEAGIAVELAAAASIAALMTGAVVAEPGERVCALICGAGSAGMP
jgi:threonine dehydratase